MRNILQGRVVSNTPNP